MIEMKKKALGGIKSMLEGRLAGRMRPPQEKPDREDEMEGPETGSPDAEDLAEGPEAPHDDLPGTEKLTPEEISQLKMLLAKME